MSTTLRLGVRQQVAVRMLIEGDGMPVRLVDFGAAIHADTYARGRRGHPEDVTCEFCLCDAVVVFVSLVRQDIAYWVDIDNSLSEQGLLTLLLQSYGGGTSDERERRAAELRRRLGALPNLEHPLFAGGR